ncbi:protein ripply1 [Heteronotia binoei]|uniref:protein ripply1 n=1 Tax=Heteronotia binoei TaxID=13085 RepID=UPI0029311389|nr:protein ripply1 [Heteronotia binoei]
MARARESEEGTKGSAMEDSLNCLTLTGSVRRTLQLLESKNHAQDPREGRSMGTRQLSDVNAVPESFRLTLSVSFPVCHRPFALWRPWLPNPQKVTKEAKTQESPAYSEGYKISKEQLTSFRHPVRLFWPKSRSFDYLYAEGEKLLENFPVQATISFYEDSEESGSDREDDEVEEDKEQRSGTAPFLQKSSCPP